MHRVSQIAKPVLALSVVFFACGAIPFLVNPRPQGETVLTGRIQSFSENDSKSHFIDIMLEGNPTKFRYTGPGAFEEVLGACRQQSEVVIGVCNAKKDVLVVRNLKFISSIRRVDDIAPILSYNQYSNEAMEQVRWAKRAMLYTAPMVIISTMLLLFGRLQKREQKD